MSEKLKASQIKDFIRMGENSLPKCNLESPQQRKRNAEDGSVGAIKVSNILKRCRDKIYTYMTLRTAETRKFCILNVHLRPGSGTTLLHGGD